MFWPVELSKWANISMPVAAAAYLCWCYKGSYGLNWHTTISVVSLSFIFTNPPEDFKKQQQQQKSVFFFTTRGAVACATIPMTTYCCALTPNDWYNQTWHFVWSWWLGDCLRLPNGLIHDHLAALIPSVSAAVCYVRGFTLGGPSESITGDHS